MEKRTDNKASVTTEGEIDVNVIDLVLDTEDVKVWHIDLHSKYAGIVGFSFNQMLLYAEGDTLHVVEEQRGNATVLDFEVPESTPEFHWHAIVDCGRYTARFVAYRQPALPLPEPLVAALKAAADYPGDTVRWDIRPRKHEA